MFIVNITIIIYNFLTDRSQTSLGFRPWMGNYSHIKRWDVITYLLPQTTLVYEVAGIWCKRIALEVTILHRCFVLRITDLLSNLINICQSWDDAVESNSFGVIITLVYWGIS